MIIFGRRFTEEKRKVLRVVVATSTFPRYEHWQIQVCTRIVVVVALLIWMFLGISVPHRRRGFRIVQ